MPYIKRAIIAGGDGFIGRNLVRALRNRDVDVIVLTRRAVANDTPGFIGERYRTWDARTGEGWASCIDDDTAIINLSGENIASFRWTERKKHGILDSRVHSVEAVCDAVSRSSRSPAVVLQASAVGIYGSRDDEVLSEESSPGKGFLADVCGRWESGCAPLEKAGIRVCRLRTGVVLDPDGGFLSSIVPAFRFFLGGCPGNGTQWIPWIHMEDEIGAILHLMDRAECKGPFNISAPEPVQAIKFFSELGHFLDRPVFMPVPAPVLKFLMGEVAREMILASQRALPVKLLQSGYYFRYYDIISAFNRLFGQVRK